jgi:hypothetical protein
MPLALAPLIAVETATDVVIVPTAPVLDTPVGLPD